MIEENKKQAAEIDALEAKLQIEGLKEMEMQIDQHGVTQWILEDQ